MIRPNQNFTMRISYSDLETYKSCPRKFKFKKDKAPYDDSADLPLRFGSAVHNALKTAYSGTLAAQSLEEILEVYHKSWPEALQKQASEAEKQTFFRGITAIKEYLEHNPPTETRVAATEKNLRLNFSGHTISGRFDRVDVIDSGYFEVIDYKTGRLPTATKLAENWQLAIYQQAVGDMFQVPRVKTSLVYVMFSGHKLSHEFNKDELAQIKYSILDTINEIERDKEFYPQPSGLCSRCGYAAICPAMRHQKLRQIGKQTFAAPLTDGKGARSGAKRSGANETGEVKADDKLAKDGTIHTRQDELQIGDIQKIIDEFIALRARINELKGKLEQYRLVLAEYMAKEDLTRLFSDIGEVSKSVSKVTTYDPEAVSKILAGTDYWLDVISVSSSKLKEIIPKLPISKRAAIAAAATIEEKVQLRVKKNAAVIAGLDD